MLDLLRFILSGAWEFVGTIFLFIVMVIIPLRIVMVSWERKGRPIVFDDKIREKLNEQ